MQSLQSGRDENYETWVCERERERDLLLHGMAKEKQCWVGDSIPPAMLMLFSHSPKLAKKEKEAHFKSLTLVKKYLQHLFFKQSEVCSLELRVSLPFSCCLLNQIINSCLGISFSNTNKFDFFFMIFYFIYALYFFYMFYVFSSLVYLKSLVIFFHLFLVHR